MQSPGQRIARHTGWTLAAHVTATAFLLVQAIVMTRALGPAGFGVIALVVTFTLTVRQLLDSRIWEPIIRFMTRFREAGRRDQEAGVFVFCVGLEIVASLIAIAVVTAMAVPAARWLTGDVANAWLFRLYGWSVFLTLPTHPVTSLLRLADRPTAIAGHGVVIAGTQLVATLVVFFNQPSIGHFLAALLIGHAAGAVVGVALGRRAAAALDLTLWQRGVLRSLRGHYGEILRFCLMTNLAGSSWILRMRIDNLLLGLLSTPAVVGVYDIARQITTQLVILFDPLQMSIYPEMAALAARKQFAQLHRLCRRITAVVAAIVIPGCLAGTLLAPWIIPLIFGADFEPTGLFVQVMVWQLLWLPAAWIPGYLLVVGRAGLATTLQWAGTLLFIGLLLVLVPVLDGLGAAISSTMHEIVLLGMCIAAFRVVSRRMSTAETQPVEIAKAA